MIKLKTSYVPESFGYDSSRLDALDKFLQAHIDRNAIFGASYALSRDGTLFAGGALGRQTYKVDDKRPLKPDSIYCIASVTKMFTATAIFQLIEQGLCRLDETMMTWIPQMEEKFPKVTIAHALSHSGGLPADGGVYPDSDKPNVWDLIGKAEESGEDWIAAALSAGPESEPGTRWEYSSFGFTLLGVLIERISGVKAERFIEKNILIPCGMSSSGFHDTIVKSSSLKKRVVITEGWIEEMFEEANEPADDSIYVPNTGGGLFSTVIDLVKYGNMLLDGGYAEGRRVIGRIAIEKMTSEYLKLPNYCWGLNGQPPVRYGLGPHLSLDDAKLGSDNVFFHEGSGLTLFMVDPVERFVSVYYTPLVNQNEWDNVAAFNTHNVIFSGLM